MKLNTTQEQFEALHLAADTGRKPEIKVSRAALASLLMDHSAMCDKLKGSIDHA